MNDKIKEDASIAYWNRVASTKTFTHPLHWPAVHRHFAPESALLDYGCGYGRLVQELIDAGFQSVTGVDPSPAMVNRGLEQGLPLVCVASPEEVTFPPASLDGILLFAVLTCIPDWEEQYKLVRSLSGMLKSGGKVYISDYYLQAAYLAQHKYEPSPNPVHLGSFSHPEGLRLRHHTREWIRELLNEWHILEEWEVPVHTMNGNAATAFQLIAQIHH